MRVENNFVFVAINIYTQLDKIEIPDGHDKVNEAIEAGAKVIVLQRDMICGKGHETMQTLKDKTIHFNDVEEVEKILSK